MLNKGRTIGSIGAVGVMVNNETERNCYPEGIRQLQETKDHCLNI